MRNIALNFLPLKSDDFTVELFVLPYVEGNRPQLGAEIAVQRRLPLEKGTGDYWTLFQRPDGGTCVRLDASTDTYLTIDALRRALIDSCRRNLDDETYEVIDDFRPRVEIRLGAKFPEGSQVICLEPYFLRSRRKFGFLVDFRFRVSSDEVRGTPRALQLSLALDKHGRQNLNYYADRFDVVADFVRVQFSRVFPLRISGGDQVDVLPRLTALGSKNLERKRYVVGSSSESASQFIGVKQNGPFSRSSDATRFYFIYQPKDHALSQVLFRALRGDTFHTFTGMEKMFRLPMSKSNVKGLPLSEFTSEEIGRVRDRVVADANGGHCVAIVLTPFSRHDEPDQNASYWHLKHAFLTAKIPIQVVASRTIEDKDKLKWSTSSIGLQIFAKAGGTPWKVRPTTERCLIVGIGQAHRRCNNRVARFFAYSVLTDSSGVFEEVRILGDENEEANYLDSLATGLRRIVQDYSDRFSSFAVHTTFTVRRSELARIAATLAACDEGVSGREFVALKFNDRTRFFGFGMQHNSRIPYESSLVSLSRDEYLVWFEGLQYDRSAPKKMVGRPVSVRFTYPRDLTDQRKMTYLQDAINLSGANWRGFNAKSLPVSVYYAQIIAHYLREFEQHGLPEVDVGILTPWFL